MSLRGERLPALRSSVSRRGNLLAKVGIAHLHLQRRPSAAVPNGVQASPSLAMTSGNLYG